MASSSRGPAADPSGRNPSIGRGRAYPCGGFHVSFSFSDTAGDGGEITTAGTDPADGTGTASEVCAGLR
jgi:hypothetical protein